jgi:hypothetical protein
VIIGEDSELECHGVKRTTLGDPPPRRGGAIVTVFSVPAFKFGIVVTFRNAMKQIKGCRPRRWTRWPDRKLTIIALRIRQRRGGTGGGGFTDNPVVLSLVVQYIHNPYSLLSDAIGKGPHSPERRRGAQPFLKSSRSLKGGACWMDPRGRVVAVSGAKAAIPKWMPQIQQQQGHREP